ncbi:hypothetical protein QFC21_005247 [Naganishia friedmannii]|uniref:Uncharacterized protein n=1 Tax=Naganishia friedmannii TaxID=89922 RepID=A0ACC2VBF9_9TREE|nr:hypothetical protein QFC21_005247 [Naganishia friedmannii]
MESRRDVAALLESMMDDDGSNPEYGSRDMSSQVKVQAKDTSPLTESSNNLDLLRFHRSMKSRRIAIRNKRIKRRETHHAKDAWIMDRMASSGMGEGSEFLCWAFEKERKRSSKMDLREPGDEESNEEDENEDEDGGEDDTGLAGQSDECDIRTSELPNTNLGHLEGDIDDSTLLVFSSDTLSAKLYHLITNYPPQAFPLSRRTLPANSIYLLARYAAYRGGDDTSGENLAGLLEMVMLEVERVCMSDERMRRLCEEEDLCPMVEEMINALQGIPNLPVAVWVRTLIERFSWSHSVHIIRLVETKLDGLIDPALLDHELADDPQVKFEDEWASTSFFRSLTAAASSKKMRNPVPAVSSLFEDSALPGSPRSAVPVTPSRSMAESSKSPRGMMDSPRASVGKTLRRPRSVTDLGASVTDTLRDALFEDTVSPSNIIGILSSTLLVLQVYSVNPAFILQIFSQVFVWMAAETFNRIISSVSGKRYQCRSKAMQIRLNLEALAEWIRLQSALPDEIYKVQFRRVTQLLQWLQCSSQITDIQIMIPTIRHLPDLTPLQLQRAIRDYRFEVGESRISSECLQHLTELQQDWERRRVKSDIDRIHREVGIRRSSRRSYESGDSPDSCFGAQDIDTLEGDEINTIFGPNAGMAPYKPASSPQSASEFEDSRFMLPLAVPQNSFLPAFVLDQIYHSMDGTGNGTSTFNNNSTFLTDTTPHHLLRYNIRQSQELLRLPADFLDWLQAVEARGGSRTPLQTIVVDPRNRKLMTMSVSSQSISVTATTPERALPSGRLSNHNQTNQSPVSPAYAHRALRLRNDGTAPQSADRPIRLRQLSSGSAGSVNGNSPMVLSEKSATSGRRHTPEGSTPPVSPLRHKGPVGSTALGNLTTQFWPRARQPSNVSVDGYVGSSDDEDSYF